MYVCRPTITSAGICNAIVKKEMDLGRGTVMHLFVADQIKCRSYIQWRREPGRAPGQHKSWAPPPPYRPTPYRRGYRIS